MSTYDELVEKAADAIFNAQPDAPKWLQWKRITTAGLDAVGLPALLAERDRYRGALEIAERALRIFDLPKIADQMAAALAGLTEYETFLGGGQ